MKSTPVAIVLLATSLVSGCAVLTPQKRANLAPFAENAISVASDVEYGLVRSRTIYTRPYADGPAVEQYARQWQGIRSILHSIVAYSVEVVTISQSHMSEREQARTLARYVDRLGRPIIESGIHNLRYTAPEFDSLVTRIGAQSKYLSALNAAQPLVDEVARVAADTLEALKVSLDLAREEVSQRINAEHFAVLHYGGALREAQTRTFRSLALLTAARHGDRTALDSLFLDDPQIREYVRNPTRVSIDEMNAMERRLLERFSNFKLIRGEIAPELEQQGREMKELDDLSYAGRTSIYKAAGAVEIWRRSHQTMAAGITDAAAFDLFGIAKQAIRRYGPVP